MLTEGCVAMQVGVIDTGVSIHHQDLTANTQKNCEDFVNGDGSCDEGSILGSSKVRHCRACREAVCQASRCLDLAACQTNLGGSLQVGINRGVTRTVTHTLRFQRCKCGCAPVCRAMARMRLASSAAPATMAWASRA